MGTAMACPEAEVVGFRDTLVAGGAEDSGAAGPDGACPAGLEGLPGETSEEGPTGGVPAGGGPAGGGPASGALPEGDSVGIGTGTTEMTGIVRVTVGDAELH